MEESRSGEFEERKRGWKRCACIIFASGTLAGKFKRKSTGQNDWEKAREIVSGWQDWGGVPETIARAAQSKAVGLALSISCSRSGSIFP
jgi:hypothetical protein